MRFFLILSLLVSPHLYGAKNPSGCSQLEHKIGRSQQAGLWGSQTPLYVTDTKGRKLPITFSHDSEIPNAETYRFVRAHPEEFKQIQAIMDQVPISVPELMNKFKMTEAQVRSFVVRKGVAQRETKNSFKASDLNPRYLSQFDNFAFNMLRFDAPTTGFAFLPVQDLQSAALSLLRKKGYLVNAHLDGVDRVVVELTHSSSEQIPTRFRAEVDGLHREIRELQTHLHLGIPSIVDRQQTLAIARAIETKIILKMLVIAPTDLREAHFTGTYLSSDSQPNYVGRGFINLSFDEFTKPVQAHDLEIRQYNSQKEAWHLLGLAAELAVNHTKLRIPAMFNPMNVPDKATLNLNGALWYAGLILEQSAEPRTKKIAEQLQSFAREIEANKNITLDMRIKIGKFLEDNDVDRLLNLQAFLRSTEHSHFLKGNLCILS